MKHLFYILAVSLLSFGIQAQSSRLVVFTENGDRFFLYVNGKLQNAGLQSNVTTKALAGAGCTLRVLFDDQSAGEKTFKLPLKPGYELTIVLKKNNKGEYVHRYGGEAPYEEETASDMPQPQSQAVQPVQAQPANQAAGTNSNNNMDVNINMNGMSTNIKYNQNVTVQESNTVTSGTQQQVQSPPKAAECGPMLSMDFDDAKKSVASKDFEDTKITEAKQVLDANCLAAKQVKELVQLFTYENSKLEVAKYAYKKCVDRKNYYLVNSAFEYESSTAELNTYIKSVK